MQAIKDVELAYRWLAGLRGSTRAPSERVEDSRARFRKQASSWLRNPDVLGYGVGHKIAGGINTGEPALQVYLRKKKSRLRVKEGLIPSVLKIPHLGRSFHVDVVEGCNVYPADRRFMSEGIRQNDKHVGPGSIGCFVQPISPSATRYALSCWHVAGLGKPMNTEVQWCDDDRGFLPNVRFGKLERNVSAASPLGNGVTRDVALIKLYPDVIGSNLSPAGAQLLGVRRSTNLQVGEVLRLSGFASKKIRLGRVLNTRTVYEVNYPSLGVFRFADVILCERFSDPGDSGAIAIDSENLGVGMLVGGGISQPGAPDVSVLIPLEPILESFSVRLSTANAQPPSWLASGVEPASADAIDKLARTIWGESEGEPALGKQAVCSVIMNRVAAKKTKRFGAGVVGVCDKNTNGVWQFSCWTQGSARRKRCEAVTSASSIFVECLDLAARAVQGKLEDVTSGSQHYCADSVSPKWAAGLTPVLVVGRHRFYNDVS